MSEAFSLLTQHLKNMKKKTYLQEKLPKIVDVAITAAVVQAFYKIIELLHPYLPLLAYEKKP